MHNLKYDSLIDEDPEIQERVARGKMEGAVDELQQVVVEAVKDQYPALLELAQEQVGLIRKPDLLRQLVKLIYKAPDEANARLALNMFSS